MSFQIPSYKETYSSYVTYLRCGNISGTAWRNANKLDFALIMISYNNSR